jgi:hypothetical protein
MKIWANQASFVLTSPLEVAVGVAIWQMHGVKDIN